MASGAHVDPRDRSRERSGDCPRGQPRECSHGRGGECSYQCSGHPPAAARSPRERRCAIILARRAYFAYVPAARRIIFSLVL